MGATGTETLTVSAYAARIQRAVRAAGAAVVEGEVQKPRRTGGGALMFDLVDGESRLPCKVLPWRLRRGLAHSPEGGDLVRIAAVHPDFWPQGGSLSVVVEEVELAGEGELLRRRAELLDRLRGEGLCDPAAFPPLPRLPRAIGVVAGSRSDALADVLRGLADRFPCAPVFTACCPVQGAGAPRALVDALGHLDLHPLVDVIVVARGGGSVRDLAAFDDEGLCRAIRAIRTPVITAIGHTENNPVCNHVTHAAFVPRHAAERVVPDRRELLRDLDDGSDAMRRAASATGRRVDQLAARALALRGHDRVRSTGAELARHGLVLEDARRQLVDGTGLALGAAREALAAGPVRLRVELASRRRVLDALPAAARPAGRAPQRVRSELDALGRTLGAAGRRVIRHAAANYSRALDRHADGRRRGGEGALRDAHQHLDRGAREADRALQAARTGLRGRTEGLLRLLAASDFRARGWLLAVDPAGRAIGSVRDLEPGGALALHLTDGRVDAIAERVRPEPVPEHVHRDPASRPPADRPPPTQEAYRA